MIDLERAMTETTLGLQNSHKDTDQEKAFEIPDAPFSPDREYISEDELEDPGTDELEVEEDLGSLESGPLELEEMSATDYCSARVTRSSPTGAPPSLGR